jgi:RNA polymerase sigma-70 factor (ECF subfamily)
MPPESEDTQRIALQAVVDTVRQAWPDLEVEDRAVVEFVAQRIPMGSGTEAFGDLRIADLYLVHACLRNQPAALQVLDREYLSGVSRVVARLRLSSEEVDEVRQLLRHRLLVGTESASAKLQQYAGRGDLRNFIRTAAVRVAQNFIQADARHASVASDLGEDVLQQGLALGEDLQLSYLRREYGEQFKQAFEEAVTRLTPRERNLLRFRHIDGLSSDALAATYGVHRATAARWVTAARERLATETRRLMMARLGVGRADLQSIMRLIQSQLDISIRRCLGPGDDA